MPQHSQPGVNKRLVPALGAKETKTATKRRSTKGKSTKPEPVKAAVIARTVQGESKSKIARDLEIDRATVRRIIDASEISRIVEEGKSECYGMVPKSVSNIEAAVNQGDVKASFGILKGTGVLKNGNSNGNQVHVGGPTFTLVISDPEEAARLLEVMGVRRGGSELAGMDDAVQADRVIP